jgi:hypothetical protein
LGIWFAAVYSSHHYVLDVLAGIACGLAGLCCSIIYMGGWGGLTGGEKVDRGG